MSKIVETVIEPLGKVPAGASCFIEPEGARLRLKVWVRGQMKAQRLLRATALPVGEYVAIDGNVVHRYSPATVISELTQHQQRVRMESPEFLAVATRIAKQLKGSLERWESHEGDFYGYRIERKIDTLDDKTLPKLMKDFADESVYLVRTSVLGAHIGLCVCPPGRELELLPRIVTNWGKDVEKLVYRAATECGAKLYALDHDLIHLKLAKQPKDPKPYVRMCERLADETGLELEDGSDIEKGLANRELFLWWD